MNTADKLKVCQEELGFLKQALAILNRTATVRLTCAKHGMQDFPCQICRERRKRRPRIL